MTVKVHPAVKVQPAEAHSLVSVKVHPAVKVHPGPSLKNVKVAVKVAVKVILAVKFDCR